MTGLSHRASRVVAPFELVCVEETSCDRVAVEDSTFERVDGLPDGVSVLVPFRESSWVNIPSAPTADW